MEILTTLWQLAGNLSTLAFELLALGWHYILIVIWVAWWLWGVNWKRAWAFLAEGAWAPAVLLIVLGALVWSRLLPGRFDFLGLVSVPNFWWQLGYVGMLSAVALFCGWLQGVFHWTPAEVNLDPPAAGHDHGHHH